jgi:hypothetical protein
MTKPTTTLSATDLKNAIRLYARSHMLTQDIVRNNSVQRDAAIAAWVKRMESQATRQGK